MLLSPAAGAVEVFEVSPERLVEIPKGKEADGIIGDFVMRNNKVELLISGNLPERRANMSTFDGPGGETPGCLYDLCPRGSANDQISIFSPLGQRGPVSWVRILKDGKDGEGEIETVTTSTSNKGLYRRHVWRLRDGMEGVEIETTLRNESAAPIRLDLEDKITQMTRSGLFPPFTWCAAVDPRDKGGYAVEAAKFDRALAPGAQRRFTRFLASAVSPAKALGILLEKAGPTGGLALTLKDTAGQPVESASATVVNGGQEAPAYADAEGKIDLRVLPGTHEVRITDAGRVPRKYSLEVAAGAVTSREIVMPPRAGVIFRITEEGTGRSLPCKVQFLAKDGTAQADLGPVYRAHGCVDQWHSETGSFTVPLPAGSYRLVITHGPEYSHLEQDITLATGREVTVTAALRRMVDTTGWISTDFHNHTTLSGDTTCGIDDRVINLAAEHIEFAVTSEHNFIYDWTPHIQRLGLSSWMSSVCGLELTGWNQHLNCFPLVPEPGHQDNGAPRWHEDPRISALTLRDWQTPDADRWVQMNHPDLARLFMDRDANGERDGGYKGIELYADTWEIENFIDPGILEEAPYRIVQNPGKPRKVLFGRRFIYLQMLNQGYRLKATAVSDAHTVHGSGAGAWRMWLPSSTDDPAKVDWREMSRAAKAGRGILSTGPFLQVTANGALPGSEIIAGGKPVLLKVKVQANDWLDIDRVQILVNGRQPKELNFTRQSYPGWFGNDVVKFEREIPVTLTEDAHLIVAVINSTGDLKTAFGTSFQASLPPMAWSNPIHVDLTGDGWKPNGDTLGYDLPHARLPTVDEASRILQLGH